MLCSSEARRFGRAYARPELRRSRPEHVDHRSTKVDRHN